MGPGFKALLLSVFLATAGRADNNTHSNWTVNVSEGGMTTAPSINDDVPEIAVIGSTVHVLWLADDAAGICGKCVIWYRRSRDNGKTWDPRVMIAAADRNFESEYLANRLMAVDNQNVVHVAWATTSPTNTFDGWLQYRRSKDGGATWDPIKTIYDVNLWPWWPTISVISTDGAKTTIAADVQSDRAGGGWIMLYTTVDGGSTFTSTSVFGTAKTDSYYLLDAKRAGDRTYVLYSDTTDLYSHVAKDYVAVVPDSGSVLGPYLVSVPAKDGNHYATIWQNYNYSPKIAVSGDKAYVVFGGTDANNVRRSFMRRLTNYGASLDTTVITSDDDPDGSVSSSDDVSVAANSAYGLMIYHVDTGDVYGGIAKMVVKRYSETQKGPVPAISLFNKTSYFRGSAYPTIVAGSGQNVYAMWQSPTLARSTDSFNTVISPVEPQPVGTWSYQWPTRIKVTLGADGIVHWVATGAFKGGKEADIIYGNWTPAPNPGSVNKALSLTTSDSGYRYDAMEAPAGAATTNFRSAMTMAVWVQVQTGGAKPCCTDIVPIVSKPEYVGGDSYVLGTAGQTPNRYPLAAIKTTVNGFRIQPPGGQGVVTEGQWYHLAFTYDSAGGANNFKLYLNGTQVSQATATGQLVTSDGPLMVGSLGSWVVDDLSLWNRALSAAEILQIKGGPLKGTESGLALYYNFDDTTMALNNPSASGTLQYQESFVPSTYATSPSACTSTLSSASQSVSWTSSNGTVNVTTGTGCNWTAVSNAPSWITVTSGSSGSGNGVVGYAVSANSTTSPRTGTITIAGQTFTVTQAAGCNFTLSPTSATVPAAAGSGSVAVTASASTCPWTASTTSTWISIGSGSSGTGDGSVSYKVSANSDTNPRNDSITIAGTVFPVTQTGASPIQITSVVNAASLTPAAAVSGGLAQGAIFSILGNGLGPGDSANPATGATATMPLATSLGNVSVQVTQGSTTVNAYPLFAWTGRIDAVMPSTMPLGSVAITVTYNGSTSDPAKATVVASNFGAYATNGKSAGRGVLMVQPSATDPGVQNSNTQTAIPGQYVTLMGTGLGAITAADNLAPPTGDLPAQLQVLVGGKTVVPVHAGRVPNQPGKDQIQFLVPLDAPPGCNTPVQVVTGSSIYSNIVTMAIDPSGKQCSTTNPWSSLADQGGKFANIFLLRLQASVSLSSDQPPADIVMDEGLAAFTNAPVGGGSLLSLLGSIPTLGTCGALGGSVNLGAALGGSTSAAGTQAIQYLDAGPAISVSGPNGAAQMAPSTDDDGNPIIPSMYGGVLGGGLGGIFGETSPPPYLDPGDYTISGTGGNDVGAFSTTLTIPPPITWTNKNDISTIDRPAGVTFNWSGGSDSQLVLLAGMVNDPATNASAGFVCFVPSSQGSFTAPVPVLANLTPTASGSLGALMMGSIPAGAATTFTASGLDNGMAFYGAFTLKTVGVQ